MKHPFSEKRRDANRRNAQASTGPKTKDGKIAASHNAIRHGLTGQVVILTPDEREAHDTFCRELIESLNPETAIERQIAHSISEDHWRLNRLRATENNILAKASAGSQSAIETALDTADAFLREVKQLQLLGLYEQRINRGIHKNMDQLRQLQTERKAERTRQLEEACLLAQLSLSQGKSYNAAADFPATSGANGQALSPQPSDRRQEPLVSGTTNGQDLSPQQSSQRRDPLVVGFVFSTAEINRTIDRNNRLNEARRLNEPAKKQNRAIAA